MKAWHFTSGTVLRDGRPVPAAGEVLKHEGAIEPCRRGLHASERLIDALTFAPGSMLHRVELEGQIVAHKGDKHVASERTILWSFDATEVLRAFARRCALDVIHLWDAPDIVKRYLETGNKSLQKNAYYEARSKFWMAQVRDKEKAAKSAASTACPYHSPEAAGWLAADAASSMKGVAYEKMMDKYNEILTAMIYAAAKQQQEPIQ